MTIQNGALVLIKIGDGGDPESFATIGGLRTSSIELGAQTIDAANVETGAWQQLLSQVGLRSLAISGTGLFSDSASEETLRGYAFAGTVNQYQFCFANGDYVTGPFLISDYERTGDYGAEETYTLRLASAGTISFTAA